MIFNISRINTEFGTFRISVMWFNESFSVSPLDIQIIEIMGTDGWGLLNQSSENVIYLIKQLRPILLAHLKTKR